MLSLHEIQRRAYGAIVRDENVLPFAAGARLAVYRNNARETFRKTLAATYPVVARLVGSECFRSIAAKFTVEFPSRAGDLGRFGGELPILLDIYYRDTEFAYLPDVARLEWAVAEVETAPSSSSVNLLGLAEVPADAHAVLRVAVRPAVRFVSSLDPVLAIWEANQSPEVARVDLRGGAENVLVARVDGEARLHRLAAGPFVLARSLADGETLGDAYDAAVAVAGELDAAAALVELARLDVLAGYRLPDRGLD